MDLNTSTSRGTRPSQTLDTPIRARAKLCYRAWELGLLTEYVGLHSNVIEITPPLTLTKEQADRGLDLLNRALSDVEAGKIPDEKIAAYAG